MAKLQCGNSNGYSSPMPVIGLYIAVASLVCLLLMLWDIFFAIRRKACYIPCQIFTLNSVTLTLLAIVAKLPVDLTTNMPSARDQLSKLTGMAMSCICIGFMAPSLASNKRSESISNMASLSIFVITVAVNTFIQLGTGVIYSFDAEHIIIVCCMFMLLAILWFNTLRFNSEKATLFKENLAHFLTIPEIQEGEPSLTHRTKSWYISSSINNPQLLLCRTPFSSAIGPISMMCLVVLLQATYRSIVAPTLEFCGGVSDYKWSMWIIVITQIVAATIGALTITFRWIATVRHWDFYHLFGIGDELHDLKLRFLLKKRRSMRTSIMVLSKFTIKSVLLVILICIHAPIFAIALIVVWFLEDDEGEVRCCMHKAREYNVSLGSWREEFNFGTVNGLSKRVIMVCVNNMNKWKNLKRDPPPYQHMVQMLSRHRPSTVPQLLNRFLHFGNYMETKYKVTCFSMVLLVKVVAASVPSILMTKSMRDTLREAFEIVYYIDKKTNVETDNSRKRQLAKLLWEGGDIDMSKVLLDDPNDPLRCAISNVRSACQILPHGPTALESTIISNFVRDREYRSIEEFCNCVEQLFSEMLQHFLVQLPKCVLNEVNDDSVEDCEERARFITRHLCELDSSLEDKVQWEFPVGFPNASCFFDSPQDHVIASSQNVISTP